MAWSFCWTKAHILHLKWHGLNLGFSSNHSAIFSKHSIYKALLTSCTWLCAAMNQREKHIHYRMCQAFRGCGFCPCAHFSNIHYQKCASQWNHRATVSLKSLNMGTLRRSGKLRYRKGTFYNPAGLTLTTLLIIKAWCGKRHRQLMKYSSELLEY